MGWGFIQRLPSRYSKNITIILICCTKEDTIANPCFLFENLWRKLAQVCQKMVTLGMPGSKPTTTQEVGRYSEPSYVHPLSTLEKAAIDAGVHVLKLLNEVGAPAANSTTTDLWQIIRYWFKPKHHRQSVFLRDLWQTCRRETLPIHRTHLKNGQRYSESCSVESLKYGVGFTASINRMRFVWWSTLSFTVRTVECYSTL